MIQRQSPDSIRSMFDSIAPTYDLLNHLLSAGLDIRWRKKAVRILAKREGGVFLDIAAGSGDVSFEMLCLRPQRIVGVDFAFNMLEIFRQKIDKRSDHLPIDVVSGDGLSLPFRDAMFDGTLIAFGIRNFSDRLQGLREMMRVLKPDGVSVILELSKPTLPVAAQLYTLYAGMLLPLVGRFVSRHNNAYRYLPESIRHFPQRDEFLELMRRAGFRDVRAIALSFGAAMIYAGRK